MIGKAFFLFYILKTRKNMVLKTGLAVEVLLACIVSGTVRE